MGSREGVIKAMKARLAKDPEVFAKMGRLGGKASGNRPFKDREKARQAGIKSGQVRRDRSVILRIKKANKVIDEHGPKR